MEGEILLGFDVFLATLEMCIWVHQLDYLCLFLDELASLATDGISLILIYRT